MTATAQLRLVAPPERRAPAVPDAQIINLTIESDERLLLVDGVNLARADQLVHESAPDPEPVRGLDNRVGRLHKIPVEALTQFVAQRRTGGRDRVGRRAREAPCRS